jgi:hypothetical protein
VFCIHLKIDPRIVRKSQIVLVERRPDTDAVEGEPGVAAELWSNGFHLIVARARSLVPM